MYTLVTQSFKFNQFQEPSTLRHPFNFIYALRTSLVHSLPYYSPSIVPRSIYSNFRDAESQIHKYTHTNLNLPEPPKIHVCFVKKRFLAMCRPINESYECGHDSLSLLHRCQRAVQANQQCETPDSTEPELRHKLACYQCQQVMNEGQDIIVMRNEKVLVARKHLGKVPEKVDTLKCWKRHHIQSRREMDSWIGRTWRCWFVLLKCSAFDDFLVYLAFLKMHSGRVLLHTHYFS